MSTFDVPLCVHCDHEEDEHLWPDACNDYTPNWPRIIRCPCPGYATHPLKVQCNLCGPLDPDDPDNSPTYAYGLR